MPISISTNPLQQVVILKSIHNQFLLNSIYYINEDGIYLKKIIEVIPPTPEVKKAMEENELVVPLYALPIIYYQALEMAGFEQILCNYINGNASIEYLKDYIYQLYQVGFHLQPHNKDLKAKLMEVIETQEEFGTPEEELEPVMDYLNYLPIDPIIFYSINPNQPSQK